MEYGLESWWTHFVWQSDLSFNAIEMPFGQDPKSGMKIFTHKIYPDGKILNRNYFHLLAIRAPLASTIASLLLQCNPSIGPFFIMHSNLESGRKRKSDMEEKGENRKIDVISIQMREPLIQTGAEKVIAHAASNGGKVRRGFVKGLLEDYYKRAPLLAITVTTSRTKCERLRKQSARRRDDVKSHQQSRSMSFTTHPF